MQSFITSRKQRALRADTALSDLPEKASAICKAAYVKFYLLDDVIRLLEYRKNKLRGGGENSDADELNRAFNIYSKTKQAAKEQIDFGNYKKVERAIPERKLLSAANAVNGYDRLIEIAQRIMLDMTGFITFD